MATSSVENENFYLYLGENPIRFEPLGGLSAVSVFFDQTNRQVFTVRSNGAGGVTVKGPDTKVSINFRLENRGDIISMRFSSDMKVLAIQRSQCALDFVNFMHGTDSLEYSQTCKGKGTKILGSCWTGLYEIVFITDRGIEQYQVLPDKKTVKLLKTVSLPVSWFVWSFESSVLLLSSGTVGNSLQPFSFKLGIITKLPKFDIELPSQAGQHEQKSLDQRDVAAAVIYGQLYILQFLHNQRRGSIRGSVGTDIVLFRISKDALATKTDILKLNVTGRCSLSVLDNLIIVHHHQSKSSFLFDIRLGGDIIGGVVHHRPFLDALPVRPFRLNLPIVPTSGGAESQELVCELYSQSCVLFPPDVILDAKLGCFWYLHLQLEPLECLVSDKCRLIDLLLLRRDSKSVILSLCSGILASPKPASLVVAAAVFNKLNRVYHSHVEAQMSDTVFNAEPVSSDTDLSSVTVHKSLVVDQSDMYTHIFSKFAQSNDIPYKFAIAVIVEYIRSLSMHHIAIQHYLYELLINTLVQHACFYQLHQFLQYHVLNDSQHLACSLLSLETVYPPAYQLALDMLKRLSTAGDSIIEVLLSKKQLLTALRFIQSVGLVDQVSARKFLDAARATGCPMTFFAVFRFFEQRNERLRGNSKFIAGEHCEEYVQHFHSLFSNVT